MKVKSFTSLTWQGQKLDDQLQNWIKVVGEIEIINIVQSSSAAGGDHCTTLTIFYKEIKNS